MIDLADQKVQTYNRGLDGYHAGKTRICDIDGKNGILSYRGIPIQELANNASFEETVALVLNGELPDVHELEAVSGTLKQWRNVPEQAIAVLDHLPEQSHPLAQFRTAMSVAACLIPEAEDVSLEAQKRRPLRILSWTSQLAAASIRHLKGVPYIEPDSRLGFSSNFLYQVLGRIPELEECRAFEVSLVVQAEHTIHAAALAALTTYSTGADLGSAVLAGMGALSGTLHGGANQTAFQMIQKIGRPEKAKSWVQKKLDEKYRFPGFGHRIYKTHDPRATALMPFAENLMEKKGETVLWETFLAVKEEIETALGSRGIYANIDSVTGLVYYPLGLPVAAFPIPFCIAIQTGWMAHCLEYTGGKMIEPGAYYITS